jgi:hypothetical protein
VGWVTARIRAESPESPRREALILAESPRREALLSESARLSQLWVLYCWPAEGCVCGRVVRVSRAAGFSHVVGYGPTSALGAAAVASLLDAASHGPAGRWVLLLPTC